MLEAAKVGSIDAGTVGDAPFTFAVAAGAPIKAVVATRSGQQGLALLVAKDSPLKDFKDIKGKRIATGKGSIGHQLVLAWLEKEGLKASDIDLVFLLPADAAIALKTGAIDGWSTWAPYTAQLEANGFRGLVDGTDVTPGIGFFIARDDAIADKAKAEALADLAGRLARARAWGVKNVDSYALTWSALVGLPSDVGLVINRRTKAQVVAIDDGVIADEQKTIDLYVRHGLIPKRFEAKAVLDPRFNAAVKAALAGNTGVTQ